MIAVLFLLAVAGDSPVLSFTKSFPGSIPAYVEVNIRQDGASEYKEDPRDENPIKLTLSAEETETMFAMAEKMGYFAKPLESGLKVAKMGDKTFRWMNGAEKKETTFNYSEDPDAKLLLDKFENIAETERVLIDLERAVRFDKLGVQSALLRLETVREGKRLMAPRQFLPMLDRVAKNESFLHMARARAAGLAESIRAENAGAK